MLKFQSDPLVWDFGSPATGLRALKDFGFACSREGNAYAYDRASSKFNLCPPDTFRFCDMYGRKGLLVEGAQTNLCLYSSENHATWVDNGTPPTRAAATSCMAGKTAIRLTSNNVDSSLRQAVGTFTNGSQCLYVIVEAGTAVAADLTMRNNTAGTAARVRLTFSSGAVSTVAGTPLASGARKLSGSGPNGGALWMLFIIWASTEGQSRMIIFSPDPVGGTKFTYLHHVQLVEAAIPTSPIVTTTAAVGRNADDITSSNAHPSYLSAMTTVATFSILHNDESTSCLLTAAAGSYAYGCCFLSGDGAGYTVYDGDTVIASTGESLAIGVNTIAVTFNEEEVMAATNGTAGSAAATDGFPLAPETMWIGQHPLFGYSNTTIHRIKFTPSYLSAAELEAACV